MQKLRVAVLRGGPSDSYLQSLATGGFVLRSLPEKFDPIDILIDKEGIWHDQGMPSEPEKILGRTDLVWNALHGTYGADGKVQNIIRHFGVPYTGPDHISAAISFSPDSRATAYERAGIRAPHRRMLDFSVGTEKLAHDLFRSFPMPARIVFSSYEHDPIVVDGFHSLHDALIRAEKIPGKNFIEEYIPGKCAGCGVIAGYRNKDHYSLLPFELTDEDHIHPGHFEKKNKDDMEKLALEAHKALGMRGYSVSYFAIHPKRGPYIISTESLPPLHDDSRLVRSLKAVGSSAEHFLGHIADLALGKRA